MTQNQLLVFRLGLIVIVLACYFALWRSQSLKDENVIVVRVGHTDLKGKIPDDPYIEFLLLATKWVLVAALSASVSVDGHLASLYRLRSVSRVWNTMPEGGLGWK